jgi:hypothetical protein
MAPEFERFEALTRMLAQTPKPGRNCRDSAGRARTA